MKIFVDKVKSGEPHTLTVHKVKILFSLLPAECRKHLQIVHLSNQLFSKNTYDRPVIYSGYSSRLTILSRGIDEANIVKEVLIELAQQGILGRDPESQLHWALSANHLKKDDYRYFEALTKGYLRDYIKVMKKDKVSTDSFRPSVDSTSLDRDAGD